METRIPFSGFYGSIHDQELDYCLENYFSNDCGECISSALFQRAYDQADWGSIHNDYAKAYVEGFAAEFELAIEYKLMVSPREYNFTTDRLFAEIELSEVERIFKLVPKEVLAKAVKDTFTSYDGFISYYSNDLDQWPKDLADWDHNQVGTLIAAYVYTIEPEFDQHKEYDLVGDPVHEVVDELFSDHIKGIDKLNKLYCYLRYREERKYING